MVTYLKVNMNTNHSLETVMSEDVSETIKAVYVRLLIISYILLNDRRVKGTKIYIYMKR